MSSKTEVKPEEETEQSAEGVSQQGLILQSIESAASNHNTSIIVKMIPPTMTSTNKLKSLLPKNLGAQPTDLKPAESSISYQVLPGSATVQNIVETISFSTADIETSFPDGKSSLPSTSQPQIILNAGLVGPEGIESLLQQLSKVSDSEKPTIVVELPPGEKTEPSIPSAETQQTCESVTLLEEDKSSSELGSKVSETEAAPVGQTLKEEESVIKKTMVEAFVKMVVCRKVTVETVDVKTGAVLDTQVKMEEEEPVVLDVDCVETTEDLIHPDAGDSVKSKLRSDVSASKWGASLDGGLKFLSAVSESRQKIAKSLIQNKLLKSESGGKSNNENDSLKITSGVIKEEQMDNDKGESKEMSDMEWNDDQEDDSEDYVPGNAKGFKQSNPSVTKINDSSGDRQSVAEKDIIYLPKRRGRKKKWNNTLGLAPNLRTCQFCNKHFRKVSNCSKHMKKGTCVSSIFCFICSQSLVTEKELESHLLSHGLEPKSGMFKCDDCHRSYRTRSGYVKHFNQGTCQRRKDLEDGFPGEHQCDLCESSFSSQDYLQLHRYKVHENPNDRHNCPDCGKKFYSWQGFQKHRSSGRSCTEPLKCHICGKTYSNKARESFKIHMKHHKTEVSGITYNCDECGRVYMTQVALNKHKLSHTGVKPYKCDVCGKEFSMRYMVKDHARMHTGERPYLCSLCGSAFSNKGHLGRHLRSHENGTLLKRGRPKKIKDPEVEPPSQETGGEIKMIDIRETIQGFDSRSIQVVDGQMFESHSGGTPMIIQADNNTIIIAEGWPDSSSSPHPVSIQNNQDIVNVATDLIPTSTT